MAHILLTLAAVCVAAANAAVLQDNMWPFSSSEVAKPSLRATPVVKSLDVTKKALVQSAVFHQKTAALCAKAKTVEEERTCEKIASERMFCSMFTRHMAKFAGMVGVAEQQEYCKSTNIMVTALDEAKNEVEEGNSQKKDD